MKQKINFKIEKKEKSIIFRLKPNIYPLETIYLTCYAFLDRAYLFLDGHPKKEIIVRLKGKESLSPRELEGLAGEFNNELLSAALRRKISQDNKKIREAVVLRALASAQIQSAAAPKQIIPKGYLLDDFLNIDVSRKKSGRKTGPRKNKSRTFRRGIRPRRKDYSAPIHSRRRATGYSGKVRDKKK